MPDFADALIAGIGAGRRLERLILHEKSRGQAAEEEAVLAILGAIALSRRLERWMLEDVAAGQEPPLMAVTDPGDLLR